MIKYYDSEDGKTKELTTKRAEEIKSVLDDIEGSFLCDKNRRAVNDAYYIIDSIMYPEVLK